MTEVFNREGSEARSYRPATLQDALIRKSAHTPKDTDTEEVKAAIANPELTVRDVTVINGRSWIVNSEADSKESGVLGEFVASIPSVRRVGETQTGIRYVVKTNGAVEIIPLYTHYPNPSARISSKLFLSEKYLNPESNKPLDLDYLKDYLEKYYGPEPYGLMARVIAVPLPGSEIISFLTLRYVEVLGRMRALQELDLLRRTSPKTLDPEKTFGDFYSQKEKDSIFPPKSYLFDPSKKRKDLKMNEDNSQNLKEILRSYMTKPREEQF